MKKIPKQAYTTEFKELAIKCVADGQTIPKAAKNVISIFLAGEREKRGR
jgi:transposase